MTDEQIITIRIGDPLPVRIYPGTTVTKWIEHEVIGTPNSIRVRVYNSESGWYFSTSSTEQRESPFKEPCAKPQVLPGQVVSSREECFEAVRQYLKAYAPE